MLIKLKFKSISKLFSKKTETDDGLSSCSIFPERPSSYELESDKPVLTEIEHLRGKRDEGNFESLRGVLNRNADVFSKPKADIGCCNFVDHEIEFEEGAIPHWKGARRMTPLKRVARIRHDRTLEIALGLRGSHGQEEGGSLGSVATFVT